MKKYILVYNPLAGDAKFKFHLDEMIEYFQKANRILIPFRTRGKEEPGGNADFAQLAVDYGADGIIAAGGDGTIHEVVNIMLKSRLDVPLGLIPSGTCNDFATHLCVGGELKHCLPAILSGVPRAVDVGKVNGDYFLNVASAGLWTSIAHTVDPALKNTLGRMAYYIKGLGQLPNFRTLRMRINADGRTIEDDIILFLVMNSGMVGSFPNLAPLAKIDDGKLDLLIVNKCSISELMGLFLSIFAGKHTHNPHITYLQATNIHIECDEPVDSDLDGELGPSLPLSISTGTNRLRIFC
ncbi:MAG TPA: YegS/Rv2252/BmrU family lipid kinase [Methylomusa anaerophila]|uniref:Diacylglycerol kinase n=1 Tax=Methylomusa anaerophila TaxID=1930071 RepID=A0A348AHJ0_9FIRM|nr:YegS/Rv2252/BmrU family lipid kinase [Methylomusa anaerophila]BBB90538.1 diacylglycerol kinase [Methylomusa anaerophila]HML89822.1 YegS/Rv2252/BmrU family lipid kinase [Methylomusa anaerophila]